MVTETELFESPSSLMFRFLFVGLDEEIILQKKFYYTRRIARSHFGCCSPHKKTWGL